MKINLVFPPFVGASCIPIGIASLKAYVEKYSPRTSIDLIDLNISFINSILDGRFNNLNYICKESNIKCIRKNDGCPFQGDLPEAMKQVFKKARFIIKDKELFLDKEIFQKYIGNIHNHVFSISHCIAKIISNYNKQGLNKDEMAVYVLKDEIGKIITNRPDMIGFSILVDNQICYALALAKMIKLILGIPIVFGGPALFNFNLEEFMDAFNFIDFIVIKEGELSLVELSENINNNKDYGNIPNLFWRRHSKVVTNEVKGIENLDSLPIPNFEGLPLNEYLSPKIILPISSSRGCPWSRCRFCQLNAQYSGPYREMSIDKVTEEIRYLQKRYGVNDFFFADSEISVNRLKKLGENIIKKKLNIYFACYIRPAKNLSLDILKIVYKAGGRFFQLGVESFSDRVLKFADKGTSAQSARDVLKNTARLKIKNLVYMLACCPRQTKKELLKDFKEIASLQKKYNIFSVVYCLYSLGTFQGWYNELQNRGLVVKSNKPFFITVQGCRVHRISPVDYTYKNKSAYHILRSNNKDKIYSSGVENKLHFYIDKFKLNSGNRTFIWHINNFLFETQLLYSYSQKNKESRKSLLMKNVALKFYAEKKAETARYLYKNNYFLDKQANIEKKNS